MSFFFRYRRIGAVPVLFVAGAYSYAFENVNNILYKTIVDKKILSEARRLGLEKHVQPAGSRKVRGLNFV